MRCPADSVFYAFVTDQLSAEREQQIAEHLEVCEACGKRFTALGSGDELRAATPAGLDEDATYGELEDLRDDLYDLLSWDGQPETVASRKTAEVLQLLMATPTDEVGGMRFGRFTIRRWLGGGGFGTVFLAHDERLHRDVALKLPRVHSLAQREVRARFLHEAHAAAQLHHPNLVPVFDAGEKQGICYIASAYCPGPTLDVWLAEQPGPVPIPTAVKLVRQLAEAVHHAHEHRVLHRDIKPSNILLQPDPLDAETPVPQITDFGLAKLLDTDAGMTGTQGLLGTPRYMAPEQAGGSSEPIGPGSDIYALGVVLYEILTGGTPFAAEDQTETLRRLREDPVPSPRRGRREIPQDLEAIALKCLEKQPGDRYASGQDLADDLRRFARGQATLARPAGPLENLRRWALRQPAIAGLLMVSVISLLAVKGVLAVHSHRLESLNSEIRSAIEVSRTARQALLEQQAQLHKVLYVSKIEMTHRAIEEHDLPQASMLLREIQAEHPELARGFVWQYLRNRVAAEGRVIEDRDAAVYDLRLSPSGDAIATCGADSRVRIYDAHTFSPIRTIATGQRETNGIAFSPDEGLLATAGDDGTVRLWDAATGELRRTIQAYPEFAYGAAFTADGASVITCGRGPAIRIWNVATGALQRTLEGHTSAVEALALSPDGTLLASASSDYTVRLWELDTGRTRTLLKGHTGRVVDIQFSPSGELLLSGSIDRTLRLWRAADGHPLQVQEHLDPVASVAFFGDAQQLVATDHRGSVHIWPRTDAAQAATALHSWKAHEGRGWKVAASPDQRGLLTTGGDGRIVHWQRPPAAQIAIEVRHPDEIQDIAFAACGERLHYLTSTEGLRSWNFADGQQMTLLAAPARNEPHGRVFSALPEGKLVTALSSNLIEGFELVSERAPQKAGPAHQASPRPAADTSLVAEPRFHLQTPWDPLVHLGTICLAASRDGRRVAFFSFVENLTLVYDVESRRRIGTFKADSHTMTLSPDGKRLAMSHNNDVTLWDVDRQQQVALLRGHTSSIVALQFSPDGRMLASGSKDRYVRLWDLQEGSEPLVLDGHRGEVGAVSFSPDGGLLASGDGRGQLKVWSLPEGTELFSLTAPAPIQRVAFSPAGNRLALQTRHQIRVLDASPSEFSGPASP